MEELEYWLQMFYPHCFLQNPETQGKQAREDLPEEQEPSPVSDFDNTYNYICMSAQTQQKYTLHTVQIIAELSDITSEVFS